MENLLKCLVRDSQALGRGFLHIKQQSQVALGIHSYHSSWIPCVNFMILMFVIFRNVRISNWVNAEHTTWATRKVFHFASFCPSFKLRTFTEAWADGCSGIQTYFTSTCFSWLLIFNFQIQKLLRDNHFVSKHCDPPDDSQWLLSQLLDCLSFPSWVKVSEEVQIEMTKVLIYSYCFNLKF